MLFYGILSSFIPYLDGKMLFNDHIKRKQGFLNLKNLL